MEVIDDLLLGDVLLGRVADLHLLPQLAVDDPLGRDFAVAGLARVGVGEEARQAAPLGAEADGGDDAVLGGGQDLAQVEDAPEQFDGGKVRIGDRVAEEGGEQRHLDAPGGFGGPIDMVRD
jgi:hypothetical protein